MGLSRSRFPISTDEAYRRVGDDTLKRLKTTFERFSSNNGLLPQATFLRDVFGDGIPPKFAEAMYRGFHGHQKGIMFNDLLKGLVLITEGTPDEKAKFLAMLICGEEGFIMKVNLQRLIADCDIHPGGEDLDSLFNQVRETNDQDGYTGIICRRPNSKEAWCTSEQFIEWIKRHPHLASFSTWLLEDRREDSGRMRLTAEPDPPTFYQTLAKKFGVGDRDVMDLEKAYWALKASNSKFDLDTFREIISPPLPLQLCDSLFELFDVNCDGHIDLSEMIRGVALCCRRNTDDKIKLCFTLLDTNKDSLLDRGELTAAMEVLTALREENTPLAEREEQRTMEDDQERHFSLLAEEALSAFAADKDQGLTADEFVQWGREDGVGQSLVNTMLQVIFEVCHVRLGLHPSSTSDEASIVKGYMVRFHNTRRKKIGTCVYLMAAEWFNNWRLHTDYEIPEHPLERLKQLQPLSYTAKQSSRSQASTYGGRSPRRTGPDNICPVVEVTPAPGNGSVVEVTRGVVLVEGEEDEDYSHVITTEPASPAVEECLPSSSTSSSGDQSNGRTTLNPVDNRPLLEPDTGHFKKVISLTNEGGRLTREKELIEFRDYYMLPEEVWKALVTWHGSANYSGGPSLPRTVIDEDGKIELYPIQFQVYKHTNYPPASKTSKTPWASIATWLGSIGIGSFGASSEAAPSPSLGLPGEPIIPHRVLYYKATFDEDTTVQLVCEQLQKVLHMKPEDLRIYDFKNEDQPELLEDEMKTIKELEFTDGYKLLVETRNKDNSWPEELIALMKEVRNSENKEAEPKPKPQGPRVTAGATGLSNLGNTCFMNSALQCISNLQPLTNYFIEKEHLLEINKQNPLGMSGVMAKRYADLVQDLWSGHSKSITPLKFRFTVARYAPRFSSFQQQDAQELLAFVLDGIHEDLNRVREKPYRELPDSEDRPDQVVADEAWKYHKERNDSIVVDLFHGQLKSVVQCRECGMKSVKFDPFTFLSLPLPMDSATNMEIIVVRLDGSQPVRYCLRQEMDDKYRRVKENISALTDIPASCFVLVDVYGGIVRSFPQDSQKVSMGLSGWLYAFEVPFPPLILVSSRSPTPEELGMTSDEEEDEGQRDDETVPENHDKEEKEEKPEPVTEMENHSPIAVVNRISEEKQEVVEEELDSDERTDFIAGKRLSLLTATSPPAESSEPAAVEATETLEAAPATKKTSLSPSHIPPPSHFSPQLHGFVFAVHRRTLRVDQYFVSTQKTRPVLFGIPMVVPCTSSTPARVIYQSIWDQLQRLVIPDPPNRETEDETTSPKSYPFQLKLVLRDGYYCSQCLWYRFCRGCLVECNDRPLPCSVLYLAIDWEESFLHLKYQGALERPIEDKSMENMKSEDNKPVNLQECFQAFSKPEELGEEEYWYCSKCKEHRPARKTLELWRLPKVLIVHLKRFQFHNGRWVKSQRPVQFPLSDLDPIDYMRRRNEEREMEQHTATPPVDDVAPGRALEPPELTNGLLHAAEVHDSEREREVVRVEEGEGSDSLQLVEEVKGEKVIETDRDTAVEEIEEETVNKEEVGSEKEAAGKETEVKSTVKEDSETVSNKESDEEVAKTEDGANRDEATERGDEEPSSQQEPLELAENGIGGSSEGISPVIDSLEETPTVYKLFSITCHSGVMGGGHYTSFARNPNGKWYYYNDSSCKETNDERVLSESPYILFYEQDGLQQHYSDFRAQIQGKKQDIGYTEDDREFEQSLKNLTAKQPQKKSSTCNQQ